MKIACPRCGADISFDPSSGKVYCEYCGSYSDISEVEMGSYEKEKVHTAEAVQQEGNVQQASYGAVKEPENDIYDEFHCSSCGAQLITDKTTTITRCVFCGSQQMIKQRLSGRFEPQKVMPFKIDKDRFINIYKTFVNKKILAPNEFRNNPYITETRGLYVPFYLYNYDITTYGRGEAQRREKDTTYYKWFEYQCKETALIPIDGSTRLDDSIMSSLEPFNMNDLTDFNPIYLTGFQAERTDEEASSLDNKAENRAVMHANRTIKSYIGSYRHTGGYEIADLTKKCDPEYVMLPIWFVNTNFNNKKYSYAVNGQTGKVVGEVPLSKPKFRTLMAILCMIATILTVGYLAVVFASSNDDDDDNRLGGVAGIWGFVVAAPYFAIKSRYKNVKHVLANPIKTWDKNEMKNETFRFKKQYTSKFPQDDIKHLRFQKYIEGKYVEDIDIGRMTAQTNVLNKNFTVDKKEL